MAVNHETTSYATGDLETRNVSVVYGSKGQDPFEAVSDVSFHVAKGEFVSIIGPSGCGKSSLLRAMGGLTPISQGEIEFDGNLVTGPDAERIGFVFQDYTLFPWRTVVANTEIGLKFRGVEKSQRRAKALQYLEMVGLGWCANKYPSQLSGGMQQRVAIARALALEPQLLLMDEPFGALDEQTRTLLGTELASIVAETQLTVVFVTHSLSEAVLLSNRIAVMSARPGQIKEIIDVPTALPRDEAFLTSTTFTEIRDAVFRSLIEEVHKQAEVNATLERSSK